MKLTKEQRVELNAQKKADRKEAKQLEKNWHKFIKLLIKKDALIWASS